MTTNRLTPSLFKLLSRINGGEEIMISRGNPFGVWRDEQKRNVNAPINGLIRAGYLDTVPFKHPAGIYDHARLTDAGRAALAALAALATALDTLARQSYARAEVSARYGNAAASVRETSKAVDYECHAETLRLRAQRLADRAVDEAEMAAEGYTRAEIARYTRRTYGEAVR
jgi:DNA-binding MarR family transcriptional regulator